MSEGSYGHATDAGANIFDLRDCTNRHRIPYLSPCPDLCLIISVISIDGLFIIGPILSTMT